MTGVARSTDVELEQLLNEEILRMYQEVADNPSGDFHFYHGREAAELFDYRPHDLDGLPQSAVASFAGVGNPHLRSNAGPGERVLDLGCGAGLDAMVTAAAVGPDGAVVGLDMNATMCAKTEANARAMGLNVECRQGRMEDIPVEDESVDLIISNGVINLSLRKRRVFEEMYRVLRPGGRISITDIVSAKQLKQNIVNDPKLWAS